MLHLQLLGDVALRSAQGVTRRDFPRRSIALLALIAQAGAEGVSRDRACALLWPDADAPRARQRLRQLLSDLRGRDVPVLRAASHLVLEPAQVSVDVVQFEALAKSGEGVELTPALALYRGALGVLLDDAGNEFDAWHASERVRLERVALSVCERLAAHHEQRGENERLVEVLQRWLEIDPCAEAAHRGLMRALMRQGRRADALAQFDRCCDALNRVHGVLPQHETVELHKTLRSAQSNASRQRLIGDAGALSIAVLPLFTTKRDAEALDPLAHGLAEDLSTALALRPTLAVVDAPMARAALARAQGDLMRASEALGVRYLVSGGLRVLDQDRVRLTLNLVSGIDALFHWGLREEFAIDDPIDERVSAWAGDLELQTCIAASGAPPAPDEPAWDSMRRAMRTMFELGWSEASVRQTIDFYRRALETDPTHALARAQKAILLALATNMGLMAGDEVRKEAREDAEQALGLAPRSSEVLGYAGCALADLGEPQRAESFVQRAIDTNPGNPQAWAAAGATHLLLGHTEKGISMLERGLRLSPDDYRRPVWYTLLAGAYHRLKKIDKAAEMALAGCSADARYYPARLALAAIEIDRGNDARASAALREALRIRPTLTAAEARGWVRKRLMARLQALWPETAGR